MVNRGLSSAVRKTALLTVLVLGLVAVTAGGRVGVYPGTDYLGTIERGETVSVDFLLVGGTEGDTASISFLQPKGTDFQPQERPYEFATENASRENVQDWVTVLDREVTLDAERPMRVNGRRVTGNGRVTYLLHVPENAEPGYHVGTFLPNLKSSADSSGMGFTTNALSRYKFVFKVPGHAYREARILGFNAKRINWQEAEVYALVQNTGTLTTSVQVSPVVHHNGTNVTFGSQGGVLSPGEIEQFRVRWDVEDVPPGRYNASGRVSWMTGASTGAGTVTVTPYQETVAAKAAQQQNDDTPHILIPFVTILLLGLVGKEVWQRRRNRN